MLPRRVCLLLSVVAAFLAALPGQAQDSNPIIEVKPGELTAYRVALQQFAEPDGSAEAARAAGLRDVLRRGLEFTSSIVTLPDEAFLGSVVSPAGSGARTPDCAEWRTSGADVLVEGSLAERDATVKIEVNVWDVARCLRLATERYVRSAATLQRAARRIADDIVGAITGNPGAYATEIAFIAVRGKDRQVALMDADGGNQRPATSGDAIKAFPDWLPAASGILYTAYVTGKQPGLFVTSRSSDVRAGALLASILPGKPKYRGVLDPSGENLALVSSVDGAAEIFRVSRSGRRLKRLTFSPAIEVSPTWSPDGRQIAFVSDRSGSPQIFVMNADGTGKRRITFQGNYNSSPAWSPDGRWIVYQTRLEAQFDIWLIDPAGEVNFPIIEHPRSDESPRWSPDGRRIVFSSTRRGRADLYSVDRTGEGLRRLTRNQGDNTHPVWGPRAR